MLWDVQEHRSKALEFARKAQVEPDRNKRELLLRMAQSSTVMARNAEWMKSNDEFLQAWRPR